MKKTLLLAVYSCFLFAVWAQTPKIAPVEEKPVSLESPFSTLRSHFNNLLPKNYHPEFAAQTLATEGLTEKEREKLAIEIQQIFVGSGHYIRLKSVPADSGYKDTAGIHRYILWEAYPEIYLEKKGKKWRYSRLSLSAVPRIHEEIYPLGTAKLLDMMPRNSLQTFFGMFYWQWLGMLILVAAGILGYMIINWLLGFLIKRFSRFKMGISLTEEARTISNPFSVLLISLLMSYCFPILQLPGVGGTIISFIWRVITPLFAVVTVYNLVDILAIIGTKFANQTNNTLDNQLVPLLRKTLKILVAVLGTIYILKSIHVNVVALLAGISVGGLALALAAQDTVKNFLGSITILLDNPFQIGDFIETDNKGGVVEEVGFRSTRIRTPEGSIITIPNAKLADSPVLNSGTHKFRKFSPKILISINTPPEKAKGFVKDIEMYITSHNLTHDKGQKAYLNNINGKNIEIMVSVLFDEASVNEQEVRQEMVQGIMTLGKKYEIEFVGDK